MRIVTCELGAGVTLACGTGSTTSAYIGHSIGRLNAVVSARTNGGVLTITSEKK
jgi:diaminopimelate epimerase